MKIDKIIYLHGLESSQGGKKVDFLCRNNFTLAPILNYRDSLDIKLTVADILKKCNENTLVIGSSAGGLLAHIIGSLVPVHTLLYNPALDFNLHNFHEWYGDKKPLSQTVVLGEKDTVVNPYKTKNLLGIQDKIIMLDNLEHRIPLDTFIDIYNKKYR